MLRVRLHKSWKIYLSTGAMNKLRNAINYAITYHGIRDKSHTVEIHFVNELKTNIKNHEGESVGRLIIKSNKESAVLLKATRNIFCIIETLFHELTHLKHVLCYDICYTQFGKTWRGEKYPVVDISKFENYWNLPDERDARYHASRMIRKWVWNWVKNKIMFWNNKQ